MKPDFKKGDGLVPVIIQNVLSMQVLMLGYMNEEAWDTSINTGFVTFYSRSKRRLWMKGETSGNKLRLLQTKTDCDNDAVLILALPEGPTCHKGTASCFEEQASKGFLYELESIINSRIDSEDATSYTNSLYKKGINKIAQKVGEEAVELVIEAKDNNAELFKNEAADLLFHFLILLRAKQTTLEEIEEVLLKRNKK